MFKGLLHSLPSLNETTLINERDDEIFTPIVQNEIELLQKVIQRVNRSLQSLQDGIQDNSIHHSPDLEAILNNTVPKVTISISLL
jgi:hypothetical protein